MQNSFRFIYWNSISVHLRFNEISLYAFLAWLPITAYYTNYCSCYLRPPVGLVVRLASRTPARANDCVDCDSIDFKIYENRILFAKSCNSQT